MLQIEERGVTGAEIIKHKTHAFGLERSHFSNRDLAGHNLLPSLLLGHGGPDGFEV